MIINAKLAKVSELREGINEATGKPWAQRNVLLAFNDDEGDQYIMVGVDEDVWKRLGLQEGEEASVRLKFYTKKMMSSYVRNIIRIVLPALPPEHQPERKNPQNA